jgi:hypothetical protein
VIHHPYTCEQPADTTTSANAIHTAVTSAATRHGNATAAAGTAHTPAAETAA